MGSKKVCNQLLHWVAGDSRTVFHIRKHMQLLHFLKLQEIFQQTCTAIEDMHGDRVWQPYQLRTGCTGASDVWLIRRPGLCTATTGCT